MALAGRGVRGETSLPTASWPFGLRATWVPERLACHGLRASSCLQW